MDDFKFNPENIFEDEKTFTNPKSGQEARTMLSKPLKQIATWINQILIPVVATKDYVSQTISNAVFEAGSADMNKSVYDIDNDGKVDNAKHADEVDTEETIVDSTKPIQAAAVYQYQLDIEATHRKRLAKDSINIDSRVGNWAIDITEEGHGTVPENWVHVEQSSGEDFVVQNATKIRNSSDSSRSCGPIWVRDKYRDSAWSKWTLLTLIYSGTSETPPSDLPEGAFYATVEE